MKLWIHVSLFLLMVISSNAQSIKPVVEDLPTYREIYTIDPITMDREGRYVRLHRFRADTLAKGAYLNGRKIGPWIFYNQEGKAMLTYNYDNGEVEELHSNTHDEISMPVRKGDDYVAGLVDTPPLYLGYQDQFLHELDLLFEVPDLCMKSGLSGASIASFSIGRDGRMRDITVDKTIHPILEASIRNALERVPGKWLPARQGDQKVESRITVIFDIQFFETQNPEYQNQFVEKPGVYILEKIFVAKPQEQQG